jgi:hypothetical protein
MKYNAEVQKFEECLPFYVNGRLGEPEMLWMQGFLAKHPEAEKYLEIDQTLKSALHDQLPDWAADQGLQAMMQRIQTGTKTTASAIKKPSKSWLDSILNVFSPAYTTPRWAFAITLLMVQTGIIGWLMANKSMPIVPDYAQTRSVGEPKAQQGPVLQITFKATATESDIRLLLVKINGVLVGGPGQLGNYLVKVSPDQIESAKNVVQNSMLIENVQILSEIPPEP